MIKTEGVAFRLKNAFFPGYWSGLCSELTITQDAKIPLIGKPTPPSRSCIDNFKKEGYFQIDLQFSKPLLTRMTSCVGQLMANGWPPIFAFLYDEFWYPARSSWLTQFLSKTLGSGYLQRPNLWCHFVGSNWQTSGWPPHVDDLQQGITVWFALTDSTLDNGCLYLIPKNFTPPAMLKRLVRARMLRAKEASSLLQSARALPVHRGTVLGWDFQTVHWGSPSKILSQPRISLSHEFVHPDLCSKQEKLSLLNPRSKLPNWNERLRLIARSIIGYKKFEPGVRQHLRLAKAILRETRPLISTK